MPKLIKNRAIIEDDWVLVRDGDAALAAYAGLASIVPLAVWLRDRSAISGAGKTGVWLGPADDPAAIADDVAILPVVAVDFPQFADGRGYSTGRLLREKYGYRGELRAIGDVLRDQLYYLEQCGFDAFAVRTDHDMADALRGFDDFSDSYQSTVVRPVPLFRRRIVA